MSKLSIKEIQNLKGKRKITKVTALNYYSAKVIQEAGIDIIGLEGPPLEIYFKGKPDGLDADLDELIFCLKAVKRGAPDTFITVPLPFKYYGKDHGRAIRAAAGLASAGADAVKVEGAGENLKMIGKIIKEGIICTGTIGHNMEIYIREGFRCIGKTSDEAVKAYNNALELQDLGVAWIGIECMPYKVSAEITKKLNVPTIGIGSGPDCDGQFLHSEDILGMLDAYFPKHSKQYLDFYSGSKEALFSFKKDVEKSIFPRESNSFEIAEQEFLRFKDEINSKLI